MPFIDLSSDVASDFDARLSLNTTGGRELTAPTLVLNSLTVVQPCRAGFLAVTDGRLCVGPLEPAATGHASVATCRSQAVHVFTSGEIHRACSAATFLPGQRLLLMGNQVTFRPSGCVTVAAHNAALDADPRNPELWRVWADQLLEALDRLGDWLMEKRWSDFELAEHLGVAAPLVRRGLLLATWNDFGFLSTLTLSAPALARHAWVADVTHVPAARHLVELTVAPARKPTPLPSPEALPLPRSLEVLRWPEPLAPSLVTRLRARSPRLTVG